MKANLCLIEFYNTYDEDKRLLPKHALDIFQNEKESLQEK